MKSGEWIENEQTRWASLVSGLPDTKQEMGAEIIKALQLNGYVHLKLPISAENYAAIAGQIGTVISRSAIKIDKEQDQLQEQKRVVKGRPGTYRADPFTFHTDNARVDVISMYCVEQDAIDGAILLLDTSDLAEHFSAAELAALSQVELWAHDVGKMNFSHLVSILSKVGESYRVYYIPWQEHKSHDGDSGETLKKFSDYLKYKEEMQTIKLAVKKHESVFIDNHRMLHGRGALTKDSKRHFDRFWIGVPTMSIEIKPAPDVSQASI